MSNGGQSITIDWSVERVDWANFPPPSDAFTWRQGYERHLLSAEQCSLCLSYVRYGDIRKDVCIQRIEICIVTIDDACISIHVSILRVSLLLGRSSSEWLKLLSYTEILIWVLSREDESRSNLDHDFSACSRL